MKLLRIEGGGCEKSEALIAKQNLLKFDMELATPIICTK